MTLTLGMDTKFDCKDIASAGLLDALFFAAGAAQQRPAGPAGPAGADGAQGVPGEAGQSAPGAPGADGADGTSGNDGVDGANGTNGSDGVDGAAGADGRDGAAGDTTIISGQKILAVRRADQPGDSGQGRYEIDLDVSDAETMPQDGSDFVVFVSIRGTFEREGKFGDGGGQQDIIIANHSIEAFDPNATPPMLTIRVETFNLIDNFFDDADFTIEVLEP